MAMTLILIKYRYTECHPNTSEHSYSQEERNTAELNNIFKDSRRDQSFTLKTINSELVSKNDSSVLFNRDPLRLMDPMYLTIFFSRLKRNVHICLVFWYADLAANGLLNDKSVQLLPCMPCSCMQEITKHLLCRSCTHPLQ